MAMATQFGHVITGKALTKPTCYTHLATAEPSISQALLKFWEVEHLPKKPILTANEERYEAIFKKTTTRANDGKFVVTMPFGSQQADLGQS